MESVDHILSSCSTIAQTQYKSKHDNVARLIHYELSKLGVFSVAGECWLHKVLENSSLKILWDFTIQTDWHLLHDRSDIVCFSFHNKTVYIIDIAVPGDSRLTQKVNEKCERLKIELQRIWNVCVQIAPLIIGCLGSVSKCLVKNLSIYCNTLVPKLQKSVLLSSCHILRRFVTEHL